MISAQHGQLGSGALILPHYTHVCVGRAQPYAQSSLTAWPVKISELYFGGRMQTSTQPRGAREV